LITLDGSRLLTPLSFPMPVTRAYLKAEKNSLRWSL